MVGAGQHAAPPAATLSHCSASPTHRMPDLHVACPARALPGHLGRLRARSLAASANPSLAGCARIPPRGVGGRSAGRRRAGEAVYIWAHAMPHAATHVLHKRAARPQREAGRAVVHKQSLLTDPALAHRAGAGHRRLRGSLAAAEPRASANLHMQAPPARHWPRRTACQRHCTIRSPVGLWGVGRPGQGQRTHPLPLRPRPPACCIDSVTQYSYPRGAASARLVIPSVPAATGNNPDVKHHGDDRQPSDNSAVQRS